MPQPYGEPATPACSSFSSLSSATPTLSGLLNTPSLHNQSVNLLKCVNSLSSTPISSSATSHSPTSQLPSYTKNKNIVAANPLLAGKATGSFPAARFIICWNFFNWIIVPIEKLAAPATPLPPTSCTTLALTLGIGHIKTESLSRPMSPFSLLTSSLNIDCDLPPLASPDSSRSKSSLVYLFISSVLRLAQWLVSLLVIQTARVRVPPFHSQKIYFFGR